MPINELALGGGAVPETVRLKDADPLLRQIQQRYSRLRRDLERVGWQETTQVSQTRELLEIVADLADLVSTVMNNVRDD